MRPRKKEEKRKERNILLNFTFSSLSCPPNFLTGVLFPFPWILVSTSNNLCQPVGRSLQTKMFTEEGKKLETQKDAHETQKEKEQRKEKNILLNFTLLLSLAHSNFLMSSLSISSDPGFQLPIICVSLYTCRIVQFTNKNLNRKSV